VVAFFARGGGSYVADFALARALVCFLFFSLLGWIPDSWECVFGDTGECSFIVGPFSSFFWLWGVDGLGVFAVVFAVGGGITRSGNL